MISKRYKRPARPQENLRQFALNNSKGVDSTKSPTDFDTICRSNNLVVNPDGSMSLRKPIVYVKNTSRFTGVKQYYLYDGVHKLEVFNNVFKITKNGDAVPVKVKYINTTGTEVVKEYPYSIDGLIIPNGNAEIVNLNSATIVGNCDVVLTELGADAVDLNLYDDVTVSDTGALKLSLPRYLRIYYSDTERVWIVQIQSPELNTISSAEGEISFNPNTTLDNMFALRDAYDVVVPSVKGILAYAPSKIDNGKVVYAPNTQISFSSAGYGEGSAAGDMSLKVQPGGEAQTSNYWDVFNGSDVECGLNGTFTWRRPNFNNLSTRLTVNVKQAVGKSYSDSDVCTIRAYGTVEYLYRYENSDNMRTWSKQTLQVSKTVRADLLKDGVDVVLPDFDNTIPLAVYAVTARFSAHIVCSISKTDVEDAWITVADVTESNKSTRYRPVTFVKKDTCRNVILKAFCNIPNIPNTKYYANWFTSEDSIDWTALDTFERSDSIKVRQIDPMWKPADNVEDSEQVYDYKTYPYYPFNGVSQNDRALLSTISSENLRIDTVYATLPDDALSNVRYRFSVIAVEKISDTDPEWGAEISGDQYRVWATVSQQEYTPVFMSECEFLQSEFANSVYGKKLYSGKSIYSYGSEKFFNNIFVSDIDSFITPLYNVIDLDAHSASQATCLVPWRDYLVSATENAIYLHTRQDGGFLTKTVNTSLGISAEDARCCKAVLNGILFKAGPKVYQLYPNVYSGDDSTLNLTEISRAVESYLEEYEPVEQHLPFAFSTESEYILMLPNATNTTCLRYDYSSKLWTVCTYPIVATDYKLMNVDDVRIFGICEGVSAEFKFDSHNSDEDAFYGDVLPNGLCPISFEWDTGQKTDNISVAKQFVESKLVFTTEDLAENFSMNLTIAIDGDPHVTTLDVSSDAPFWSTGDSVGALNTSIRSGSSDAVGVFRQLIVRYSGKGRSVRHILTGTPTSNFRLYETYIRYKTLNVKR